MRPALTTSVSSPVPSPAPPAVPADGHSDVLALIPALNESQTIADVVTAARRHLACDVLVIDDGSSDATGALASGAGAYVLTHPFNLGVGAAIRSGILHARMQGYAKVIQVDGDGQHDPADARRMLELLDQGADLVVGSRFAEDGTRSEKYQVGWARRLSMKFLARVATRETGTTITDATSGYRAFGPRAVALFARHYPTTYLSDTVEALLMAGAADLKVVEVGVQMHQRQGGVASANKLKSLAYLARLNLIIVIHPFRRAPQLRAPLATGDDPTGQGAPA